MPLMRKRLRDALLACLDALGVVLALASMLALGAGVFAFLRHGPGEFPADAVAVAGLLAFGAAVVLALHYRWER